MDSLLFLHQPRAFFSFSAKGFKTCWFLLPLMQISTFFHIPCPAVLLCLIYLSSLDLFQSASSLLIPFGYCYAEATRHLDSLPGRGKHLAEIFLRCCGPPQQIISGDSFFGLSISNAVSLSFLVLQYFPQAPNSFHFPLYPLPTLIP